MLTNKWVQLRTVKFGVLTLGFNQKKKRAVLRLIFTDPMTGRYPITLDGWDRLSPTIAIGSSRSSVR